MKLLKLKIKTRFRSLQEGFEIDFHKSYDNKIGEFHPFCFAGLNGSGKSNVLEVLSAIFYHLECCTLEFLPEDFAINFKSEKGDPDSFEIEYLILPRGSTKRNKLKVENLVKVIITKDKDRKPKIAIIEDWQNETQEYEFEEIDKPAKIFLPELVIGYSSGENEILSLPFFKTKFIHYDEYTQYLNQGYKNYKEPENSLVYIDYSLSQAVLLSNFLLQPEDVLKPIKKELNIDDIRKFRLVFYHNRIINKKPILKLFEKTIKKLKDCSTCWFYDSDKSITYIDYSVTPEIREAFRENFKNDPFELFRTFQILLTLNLYFVDSHSKGLKKTIYNTNSLFAEEKIPVPATDDHVFYFNDFLIKKNDQKKGILIKSFSDGEHQFLHTMGICLMLKNRSTLLLLDEPETHFNPDWRSKFIHTLKKCLEFGGWSNLMKDILITTHSPFIISDCKKERVKWFQKEGMFSQIIPLDFETYGASIDYIHKRLFNKNLIPVDAFEKLTTLIETGNIVDLRKGIEEFGESSQKQFLFKRIYELTEQTKGKKKKK